MFLSLPLFHKVKEIGHIVYINGCECATHSPRIILYSWKSLPRLCQHTLMMPILSFR